MTNDHKDHPNCVPLQHTNVTEPEVYNALKKAWKELFNIEPSQKTLCILLSQWALETGRGSFCRNYNLGNVKRPKNYDGYFTMFPDTGEIIDGKEIIFQPPHPQTHFKAFPSLKDGCIDYIKFLNGKRYKEGFEELVNGDVVAYTIAIHKAGYFTASLIRYTTTMSKVYEEYIKKANYFDNYYGKEEIKAPLILLQGIPEKKITESELGAQKTQNVGIVVFVTVVAFVTYFLDLFK